jgi:hypothetical protein
MKSAVIVNEQATNNLASQEVDDDIVLGLPRLKPGQTCSIMDLEGCLAGRAITRPSLSRTWTRR